MEYSVEAKEVEIYNNLKNIKDCLKIVSSIISNLFDLFLVDDIQDNFQSYLYSSVNKKKDKENCRPEVQ